MIRLTDRSILFFFIILLSSGLAGQGFGSERTSPAPSDTDSDRAVRSLAFGDFLLERGEYYRAVTEYYRTLHLLGDPDSEISLRAAAGIGEAYYRGADFIRAGSWLFENRREILASGSRKSRSLLYNSLIRSKKAQEALKILESDDAEGRFFYTGIAFAALTKWDMASESFRKVPPADYYYENSTYNIAVCARAADDHHRSPKLAGFLAIIPGAGYCYAGHKRSAFAALLVNSIFITASIQAFDHEEYFLGGGLSAVALTWYAGNIKGSVDSAKRYNRNLDRRYFDQLSIK